MEVTDFQCLEAHPRLQRSAAHKPAPRMQTPPAPACSLERSPRARTARASEDPTRERKLQMGNMWGKHKTNHTTNNAIKHSNINSQTSHTTITLTHQPPHTQTCVRFGSGCGCNLPQAVLYCTVLYCNLLPFWFGAIVPQMEPRRRAPSCWKTRPPPISSSSAA